MEKLGGERKMLQVLNQANKAIRWIEVLWVICKKE